MMRRGIIAVTFVILANVAHADDEPRTALDRALLTTSAVVIEQHVPLGNSTGEPLAAWAEQRRWIRVNHVIVRVADRPPVSGVEIVTPEGVAHIDTDEIPALLAALTSLKRQRTEWAADASPGFAFARYVTRGGVKFEALRAAAAARMQPPYFYRTVEFSVGIEGHAALPITAAEFERIQAALAQ